VPRYLGPIAPLLVLGLWQGLQAIGRAVARPWAPPLAAGGAAVLLGSAGVCNLAILTVNAYVARSSNYHDLCLAGEYAEVIRIGKYLRGDSSPPGPVGLYVRYRDPIRSKDSSWMHRAIVLLSQRGVRRIPPVLGGRADAQALADWARSEGVGVVVLRPRRLESRLWHLRLTPGGSGENPSGPFYVLYQLKNDQLAQVDLPEITGGLRRVPGL
jgi:hypothetical protein